MIRLIKQEGHTMYGIEEWIINLIEELYTDQRLNKATPGTICTIIDTQAQSEDGIAPLTKYLLSFNGLWIKLEEPTASTGAKVEYIETEKGYTLRVG